MEGQLTWAILITIFGLVFWGFGLFYLTKKRFLKEFDVLKDITPLPGIYNYWIVKSMILCGGLLILPLGLYGIIQNL
ncbi:hypothetical protein [Pseudobacillus badius]|uniref:hypothetical protein n=1 Tax=Bacillus badius TaxID=1455 RepID=UPI000B42CEEB|nr:hypothetical protein [Bacillus badius]OVE45650.1 hypothetical protein B1A98_20050 [Bacillus badius]TDV96877.1 hypothetical protein B0G66_1601 [Bacillus badius]